MIIPPLRKIYGTEQIDSTLESAFLKEEVVTLWQKVEEDRLIIPAKVSVYDKLNRSLVLHHEGIPFDFFENQPLYCWSSTSFLIFKGLIQNQRSSLIVFGKFNQIVAKEERANRRIQYSRLENHCVHFSRNTTHPDRIMQRRIWDISTHGFSFQVSRFEVSAFQAQDQIRVFYLPGTFLRQSLVATLRYFKPLGKNARESDYYRVGAVFHKPLRYEGEHFIN